MGKVFGVLVIVVGIWVGLEIYTEGVRGAFGGALASLAPEAAEEGAPAEPHRWAGERARDSVLRAHEKGAERRSRQLDR